DSGAFSLSNWATAISAGPGEGAQTVHFNVTNNTNSGLFSAGPAIDGSGNLTFTPAADANGTATITIAAQDDGGTANSGVDTSATQSFVINVTAVNDAPVVNAGHSLAYTENDPAKAIEPALLVSDIDSANLTGATVT